MVLNRVGLINPHKTHISLPVGHLSPLQKKKQPLDVRYFSVCSPFTDQC